MGEKGREKDDQRKADRKEERKVAKKRENKGNADGTERKEAEIGKSNIRAKKNARMCATECGEAG